MVPNALIQRRDEQVAQIPLPSPTNEYVASGLYSTLSQAITALPPYSDDIQREQSDEIYERMIKDGAVGSALDTLNEIVLAQEPRVECAIADKKSPEYETARKIADFVELNLARLDRPLIQILTEMMNAFVYGSSLAEKIYTPMQVPGMGLKLVLTKLRPLSRKTYNFVVDEFGNVYGFTVRRPGLSSPLSYANPADVVAREKFAMLQFGVVGGDPRGRSQIRKAYNPWWFKLQTFPRWLKYLQQFSTPSLVGYTPPSTDDFVTLKDPVTGQTITDANGRPRTITPEQSLLNAMLQFQAGSAMALKHGAKIDTIQSQGEGRAFVETLDALDRQIFLAILGNARGNMEAKNGSKADSEGANDSLSRKGEFVRRHLDEMLYRDISHHIVKINFGEEMADKYAPKITLRAADKEDFAKVASGVASLFREGFFHDSQIEGLDAFMGLPKRDMDAYLREQEEERDRQEQERRDRARVSNPLQGM